MSEEGGDVGSSGEGDVGLSFSGDENLIIFDTGERKEWEKKESRVESELSRTAQDERRDTHDMNVLMKSA